MRQRLFARFVVWAGGAMQTPRVPDIRGKSLGLHVLHARYLLENTDTYRIGDTVVVIGGGEFGMDVALRLIESEVAVARVVVCDGQSPWL